MWFCNLAAASLEVSSLLCRTELQQIAVGISRAAFHGLVCVLGTNASTHCMGCFHTCTWPVGLLIVAALLAAACPTRLPILHLPALNSSDCSVLQVVLTACTCAAAEGEDGCEGLSEGCQGSLLAMEQLLQLPTRLAQAAQLGRNRALAAYNAEGVMEGYVKALWVLSM